MKMPNTMSTKMARDTTRTTASLLERNEVATRRGFGDGDGGYRTLWSDGNRAMLLPRSFTSSTGSVTGT